MKLIAHRGNVDSREETRENEPDYIQAAVERGFDVEIDVWVRGDRFLLGHDEGLYSVEIGFLSNERFWCHCKTRETLRALLETKAHCFFHEEDSVTLTSRGVMWAFPSSEPLPGSVCVLPELHALTLDSLRDCYGICSDRINDYRGMFS